MLSLFPQTLFAVGCILLKMKRSNMKRDEVSSKFNVFVGVVLVVWGLLGNIIRSPTTVAFFVSHALPPVVIVLVTYVANCWRRPFTLGQSRALCA